MHTLKLSIEFNYDLQLNFCSQALHSLFFISKINKQTKLSEQPYWLIEATKQLQSYFREEHFDFTQIPLAKKSFSPFTGRIYQTLRETSPGEVLSYGELALRAGFPKAAQAVGTSMRNNPWPILIPCHRIIKADGCLGLYTGLGGVQTKEKLLSLEQIAPR